MSHPDSARYAPPDFPRDGAQPIHRMPVGFGPFPGPRQIPHPGRRDPTSSRRTIAAVTCETETEAIRNLLPSCFEPGTIPTVTVEVQQLENLDWLAGRGYSTLGVKFPALYRRGTEAIEGDFLAVLWENLADPIISGREELGFAKLWCSIEETTQIGNRREYAANWLGHCFAKLELGELTESSSPASPRRPLLHYKHIPKTGCPGEADAAYAVMTPAANPAFVVEKCFTAKGRFEFLPSTWEQLPTLAHIVNPLASLPIKRFVGASLVISHGGKDLSDQSILESHT